MPADAPTIVATSGGFRPATRIPWEVGPLTEYAIELAGTSGRAPRVCLVPTAMGDHPMVLTSFYAAAQERGLAASQLTLFPMPNVVDILDHLLDQDVIWVWGGSVAGLLAMWRLHGVDEAMRAAWQAGVVLTGISAGSICWHVGGTTDSFGPELRPVTDGLALVPFSNGVHYDTDPQRRTLMQALIADGTLPTGYATAEGAGVHYRGTEFVEALAERDGAAVYRVERAGDDGVTEARLPTRVL